MTTRVLFRKDSYGVQAVFPDLEGSPGCVTCYAHIGQHGSCNRSWYMTTKAARPDEYDDLLRELVSIGYDDLKIYKRWRL